VKIITLKVLLVSSLFLIQACNDDNDNKTNVTDTPAASNTIVDVAVNNGNFTTLVAALQATGLDETLADTSKEFTVFAPTDDAFNLLGQTTIDALLADTDTLSNILTYHVIDGQVNAETAIASVGNKVEMVNGDSVGLSLDGDMLLVNTVTVTSTDIMTDNGIIHVIDAVLIPPVSMGEPTLNIVETAIADGRFTTLVTALQAANLVSALEDTTTQYTVFAPTDDAFALIAPATLNALIADTSALTNVLLQHVVEGQVDSVTAYSLNGNSATTLSGAMIPVSINSQTDSLLFGGAKVIIKDIYTTNGVIHVIDAVVVGEVELPALPMSVVDVAIDNGNFTMLAAALQATGLDTVLADLDTDFTVFAPTDAAFALLGQTTIDSLLADTDTLSDILLYHVIPNAKVLSDGAIAKANSTDKKVTMANMLVAALSISDDNLYINKSKISAADVMADNGVIHVIDQVILPPTVKVTPTMSITDVATSLPEFSTLVTALSAANLVTTLSDETATFTVFAPTNNAFAKIDSTVLSNLLADNTALTNVLLQHVIGGAEVTSIDAFAANGTNVDTLSGEDVSVSIVNFSETTNTDMDEVAYDAVNQQLVGAMGSNKPGFTVYVFDNDLGTSSSSCVESCATAWPPVLVTDEDVSNIPGLSIITRDDETKQVAYLGRPLYFFASDMAVGDELGQGANSAWWKVSQEQVSLQVQGSNLTTTDIYTTNGVIHVIDTVITETLN
jgi:uncharacterized surface protein with fasciclin (FAS1) repeats